METIDELVRQEHISTEYEELPCKIEEIHEDVDSLSKRLDRLAKLQVLLKEKYRKRLEDLNEQLNNIGKQQNELESLAKQFKKNKEKRSILSKQAASLESRKKTIRGTVKQVAGYEKSSSKQVELIEEEREILHQRVHDLVQTLELAKKAELDKNELKILRQRVYATKGLLEEQEINLRKQTIDLLFEFYIPPKGRKLL